MQNKVAHHKKEEWWDDIASKISKGWKEPGKARQVMKVQNGGILSQSDHSFGRTADNKFANTVGKQSCLNACKWGQ